MSGKFHVRSTQKLSFVNWLYEKENSRNDETRFSNLLTQTFVKSKSSETLISQV